MIPKAQRLDVLLRQKILPRPVAEEPFWQTVLKAIKLDVQLCISAVKIQDVISDRVLAAEFETGETPTA